MTVRTRADLDQLPAYVAGRSVPGSIKLASNEVSAGPLPGVLDAINAVGSEVHRYPDAGVTRLTEALAQRLDVTPERVVTGCGSVALCQQLVQITCGPQDEVMFPWRSFEAYPIITRVVGATPVQIPLTEDHGVDLDAMVEAITPATRLVFVCTPNNPSGTLLRKEQVERFLRRVPSDVLVVLDEAYWEFVTDPDTPNGVELAQTRDNVVSLRTFSKAYGLAGLRTGYAVASEPVAGALRKVSVPFSVNAVAQAAALASLDAQDEMDRRCAEIASERIRVRAALLDAGYEVPETQANFVWLPLRERTKPFNEHCMDNKVIVRAFAGEGARVTVGQPAENDTFLAAARTFR